jgi:hypothetical protein
MVKTMMFLPLLLENFHFLLFKHGTAQPPMIYKYLTEILVLLFMVNVLNYVLIKRVN